MTSRKYGKPDANHADIVKALTRAGCDVLDLKAVGNGAPDLLVARPYYPHHYFLLEVKDGEKPPSARKLTPDQVDFHARWKAPIHVVTSVEEALDAVGIVRRQP
jgi:hypothetical protein